MHKKLLLATVAAALALTLGLHGAKAGGGAAYKIGDKIQDFALKDENGKTVRLSQYRGKPVLLNFYALW